MSSQNEHAERTSGPSRLRPTLIVATLLATCLATAALSPRAGPAAADPASAECTSSEAGRVLDTTALAQHRAADVAGELREVGLPDNGSHDVETFRVEYCTTTTSGEPIAASGLLALPWAPPPPGPMPLVVYAHSTAAGDTDAPSFQRETDSRLLPFFFASDGFAVVAPDYLGLGTSPGRHPYLHAATEASATIDLLRAAEAVTSARGIQLSRDVLITGHSQGGHAAMAIAQALEAGDGSWRTAALAPMSGPFDLSGAESAAVLDPSRTDPQHASFYMAYIFTAWKDLYDLYTDPDEIFTPAYAGIVEDLFDGTRGILEIDAVLPAPEELFRPEILALIANPSGTYAAALRSNDVCHWAPSAPTRLYQSRADRDVVFANAERCRQQIMSAGGTARIIDMGAADHIGTAVTSAPLIRTWFAEFR